jgi:Cd2+/Zn2+-exporting ATPase
LLDNVLDQLRLVAVRVVAAAVHDLMPLSDEQAARIAALNAEGKTVSVLMSGSVVAGLIAMRDEPRADARSGLVLLKRQASGPSC